MAKFLHVGCGNKRKNQTTRGFNTAAWEEIRLDIDPSIQPDVIGSMTDMSAINDGFVNAVFSSHNIEHLYPHEVMIALTEFKRVLADDGFVLITCPDLQSVAKLISEDKLLEPAYQSPAGPIAPLDILYGFRSALAAGNLYMAHRCGFTQKVLHGVMLAAGFKRVATIARGYHPYFDLWAIATKNDGSDEELRLLASQHFPQ